MSETTGPVTMDKIVSLCRRRGFVFPSSEIYGGLGSTYDYGHYGVLAKNNIRQLWFQAMVQEREDIVALDSAIILNPAVWEASGHVAGFTDPLVDCRTCKLRFRADKLEDAQCGRKPSKRPGETPDCDLTEARQFNLMFQTQVGALEDASSTAYLRPETAQGIFINFKNVLQLARRKPPFGIAQVGKSFRNEITPGNFLFRVREFEQMEMEFFVPPAEAEQWYRYWVDARFDWYLKYGLREGNLRKREHDAEERSHYSSGTTDIEYLYPIGWSELEGVANRGDFDLTQHTQFSGTKLEFVGQEGERYTPHVIEPAVSIERIFVAMLVDAYHEEVVADRERTVLRLHPAVAPVKAAILPLIPRNDDMVTHARGLFDELRKRHLVEYDDSGQIGRRYRRQDEIGTPWAFTIDDQTLEDETVTVRDRDSLAQDRLPISGVRGVARGRARAAVEPARRLALHGAALDEPLVRLEAEPGVEPVRVARVEDPAAVGVRTVLDHLPDELDAETAALALVEDVHVGEVHEPPGVEGGRTREADLAPVAVEADHADTRVDELVLLCAGPARRPVRLGAEVCVDRIAVEPCRVVVELVAVTEVTFHAASVAWAHATVVGCRFREDGSSSRPRRVRCSRARRRRPRVERARVHRRLGLPPAVTGVVGRGARAARRAPGRRAPALAGRVARRGSRSRRRRREHPRGAPARRSRAESARRRPGRVQPRGRAHRLLGADRHRHARPSGDPSPLVHRPARSASGVGSRAAPSPRALTS